MAEFLEIKVSRDRLLLMKRLVVLMLALALLASPSAHGFFNKDCKNLAKRTASNQAKYDKAWDTYQKVLADWINAGAKVSGTSVVISRIDQVGNAQVKIIDDFIANRKCLTNSNPSFYATQKTQVTLAMRGARQVVLQFDYPFREVIDYTKYLKK